jgi:hypothetical protein
MRTINPSPGSYAGVRLACASCDFLLDEEMFAALGSCPACGSAGTREVEECARCGAAFPRGRSCDVCTSPAPVTQEEREVEDSFDVDRFLAGLGSEPARRPPTKSGGRLAPPTRPRKALSSAEPDVASDGIMEEGTEPSAAVPLPSREERLPPPELLRELREEGRHLLAQ